MLSQVYRLIMDPEMNGLWRLPKIVRFQFMTMLAFMWSAVFTVWTGSISVFGPSAVGHTILLFGVFFTADIFRRVQQHPAQLQPVHHRDAIRNSKNGMALYVEYRAHPERG
jgi:hypothetical protein